MATAIPIVESTVPYPDPANCANCKREADGFCDDCGAKVHEEVSDEVKALTGGGHPTMGFRGYQHPQPTHFHLVHGGDGGKVSKSAIYGELCLDCYRKEWARVYPDVPCQV